MTSTVSHAAGVTVGKRALHQMRAILERETGVQAALLLREVGFATGEALYEALEQWTRTHYNVESPRELDNAYLSEALAGFFADAGWGDVTLSEITPTVLGLDAPRWAEATPHGAEYPSCHFSCGMLADFFTRLGGSQAAVMEVECGSRGEPRCRFLVGSPDLLTYVYERMTTGMGYLEAVTGQAAANTQ
ncbi:MAG TPA: V4R domain-containing protein [Gemmatimonadales bacterium]|jgi:predicted hydrocarbon binding protein